MALEFIDVSGFGVQDIGGAGGFGVWHEDSIWVGYGIDVYTAMHRFPSYTVQLFGVQCVRLSALSLWISSCSMRCAATRMVMHKAGSSVTTG